MIIIVFALFSVALGHNWVNSISRSTGANTNKPAAPSKTGQPHVQVAAGQYFQAEWVQGHGSDSYFILAAEKDYQHLHKSQSKLLDDYLNEAGATKGPPPPRTMKYHRVYSDKNTPSRNHGKNTNYFTKFVERDSEFFIRRDLGFEGRFSGAPRGRGVGVNPDFVHQAIYPSECMKTDRVSLHKSAKYPWIMGVHKYRICVSVPNRPDVAVFAFPPGTPPGKYFLQWAWRGYYDIIDVQIVTGAPVLNPYGATLPPGVAPPPAVWKRVEHCEFLAPQKTYGCLKIEEGRSEQQCMSDCARSAYAECNGVNVVSVHNPTSVYPAFRDMVNIPFGEQCRKSVLETSPANPKIKACYALKIRAESDLPDEQEMLITDDPDEPAFYSTCWRRVPPVNFDTKPEPEPYRPPRFLFGQKCISCENAFANRDTRRAQHWELQDNTGVCVNCDALPRPPVPKPSLWFVWKDGKPASIGASQPASFTPTSVTAGPELVSGQPSMAFGGSSKIDLGLTKLREGTTSILVAAWVRFTAFTVSDARVFTQATGTSDRDHGIMISTVSRDAGGVAWRLRVRLDGDTFVSAADEALKANQWYHVALWYNGDEVSLWQDGKAILTLTGPEVRGKKFTNKADAPMAIGDHTKGSKGFRGAIADLRVYTDIPETVPAVLTPALLYQYGAYPKEP